MQMLVSFTDTSSPAKCSMFSIFTNGTVFLKKGTPFIEELMDAGLNIFNIDCYNNTYDRFSEMVKKLSNQIRVADFP